MKYISIETKTISVLL